MKAHIGADADSGLVHSLHVTAANESDIAQTHELLHGDETTVHADAGYTGIEKREEIIEATTEKRIRHDLQWRIAARRSRLKMLPDGPYKDLVKAIERAKA